jgi:hypothetical protein
MPNHKRLLGIKINNLALRPLFFLICVASMFFLSQNEIRQTIILPEDLSVRSEMRVVDGMSYFNPFQEEAFTYTMDGVVTIDSIWVGYTYKGDIYEFHRKFGEYYQVFHDQTEKSIQKLIRSSTLDCEGSPRYQQLCYLGELLPRSVPDNVLFKGRFGVKFRAGVDIFNVVSSSPAKSIGDI